VSTGWPWPAPIDDGAAAHLTAGYALPDLDLPQSDGTVLNLARHRPERLVVYIYPWTGRPGLDNPPDWDHVPGAHGSTPQAQGFANLHSAFVDHDADVVGVSGQSTDWQHEFATRLRLPFPLASDAGGRLAQVLNLPTFTTGGVTYLKRLTIVARRGLIEHVWYPAHPPDVHPREVLAWLSATAGYALESRLKR
jgi:peroxiredoxin